MLQRSLLDRNGAIPGTRASFAASPVRRCRRSRAVARPRRAGGSRPGSVELSSALTPAGPEFGSVRQRRALRRSSPRSAPGTGGRTERAGPLLRPELPLPALRAEHVLPAPPVRLGPPFLVRMLAGARGTITVGAESPAPRGCSTDRDARLIASLRLPSPAGWRTPEGDASVPAPTGPTRNYGAPLPAPRAGTPPAHRPVPTWSDATAATGAASSVGMVRGRPGHCPPVCQGCTIVVDE